MCSSDLVPVADGTADVARLRDRARTLETVRSDRPNDGTVAVCRRQRNPRARKRTAAVSTGTDTLPDPFTAFQEQLGLKLNATKAPADLLVIDNVSKPSEN